MPFTGDTVPVIASQIDPSDRRKIHGSAFRLTCDDFGSGLVSFKMNPSVLRAGSAAQTSCSRFSATVKHGSLIEFPIEHRHAPGRGAAIDSVQHDPSFVSPPLGRGGANRMIVVPVTVNGLAGVCARADVAHNISAKLTRYTLPLIT